MERKGAFDPYNLSPIEYSGLVASCCQNWRQEIADFLGVLLPESLREVVAIVAVGSDGKEERHPQSKTELVIICATQNSQQNNN